MKKKERRSEFRVEEEKGKSEESRGIVFSFFPLRNLSLLSLSLLSLLSFFPSPNRLAHKLLVHSQVPKSEALSKFTKKFLDIPLENGFSVSHPPSPVFLDSLSLGSL